MGVNCTDRCVDYCAPDEGAVGASYVGDGNCACKCGGCPRTGCRPNGVLPDKKPMRKRKLRFGGINPVRQRPIGVNPSQGGFFSVPSDERNFGQQASLPYEQQLNMNHKSNFAHSNFAHSNASGCGYSNMNHSNFGANTASTTWSGAQTNVGPQDRVFAGNYASGEHGPYSNFVKCYDDMCCFRAGRDYCGSNPHNWEALDGGGCNFSCVGAMTAGGGAIAHRQPQKALRTRLGGGRGGSMRRTSRR